MLGGCSGKGWVGSGRHVFAFVVVIAESASLVTAVITAVTSCFALDGGGGCSSSSDCAATSSRAVGAYGKQALSAWWRVVHSTQFGVVVFLLCCRPCQTAFDQPSKPCQSIRSRKAQLAPLGFVGRGVGR